MCIRQYSENDEVLGVCQAGLDESQQGAGLHCGGPVPLRRQGAAGDPEEARVADRRALLPGAQDLSAGAAEDGDARAVWRPPGGDGDDARQAAGQHHGMHGRVRSARGGHRDPGQRPGRGLRVHVPVLHHQQGGVSP